MSSTASLKLGGSGSDSTSGGKGGGKDVHRGKTKMNSYCLERGENEVTAIVFSRLSRALARKAAELGLYDKWRRWTRKSRRVEEKIGGRPPTPTAYLLRAKGRQCS